MLQPTKINWALVVQCYSLLGKVFAFLSLALGSFETCNYYIRCVDQVAESRWNQATKNFLTSDEFLSWDTVVAFSEKSEIQISRNSRKPAISESQSKFLFSRKSLSTRKSSVSWKTLLFNKFWNQPTFNFRFDWCPGYHHVVQS